MNMPATKTNSNMHSVAEYFGISVSHIAGGEKIKKLVESGMNLQFDWNKYEDAIACYQAAIKLNSDCWEAWLLRGITLCQVDQYKEAVTSLAKVIDIQPNIKATISALNGQAFALTKMGRNLEAIGAYNTALEIQPNDAGTLKNRQRLLQNLWRY